MDETAVHMKTTVVAGQNDITESASENASSDENTSPVTNDRDSSTPENRPRARFLQINKPLVPLKAAFFCWYGGTLTITVFLGIFLRQRGLPVGQFSFILSFSPFFQLLGSIVSGMLADKFGRGRPILFVNLFLTVVSSNSMLFLPAPDSHSCHDAFITCAPQSLSNGSAITECDITDGEVSLMHCSLHCSANVHPVSESCLQNYISRCDLLKHHDLPHNLNLQQFDSGAETSLCTNVSQDVLNSSTFCDNHVAAQCVLSCERNNFTISGKADCQNYEEMKLFVFSFIAIISFYTGSTNCFRVFDFTAMYMVKSHGSDYGRQRFWAVIGILFCSLLSGAIISLISSQKELKRYDVVFFLFDILVVLVIFAAWKLEVKAQPRTKNILVKFFRYSKNLDRGVFLVMVLVCGTMFNFNASLANLYLEGELDASGILMGLNPAIVSVLSLPFLFSSQWFVNKIGSTNIVLLALGAYTIHFIGFSFLTNPWWSLLYQPLSVVSYHLLWVAVVQHSHTTAPAGFTATAVSIAGALHFGAGRGTASLIGGFIMSKYGGRIACRALGTICAATAVLYSLFLHVRGKTKRQLQECRYSKEKETDHNPEMLKTNINSEDPDRKET